MGIFSYFFKAPEVELYLFQCGAMHYPYVATSSETYVYGGRKYEPEVVSRSSIHYSEDYAKDVLTVTVPATNDVSALFFTGTPEHLVRLTVLRGRRGDATMTQIWAAVVNGATYSYDDGAYSCELSCETAAARMERLGLARCYQLSCPHVLYGKWCGVNAVSYASGRTVTAVSGASVTVSGWASDNYYAGGRFRTSAGELRFISSNSGNVMRLDRPLAVAVGTAVTLWPGCDKSRSTCMDKFGNGRAFGGFPWLPVKNPYTSTIG